jgi:hypothetical protein
MRPFADAADHAALAAARRLSATTGWSDLNPPETEIPSGLTSAAYAASVWRAGAKLRIMGVKLTDPQLVMESVVAQRENLRLRVGGCLPCLTSLGRELWEASHRSIDDRMHAAQPFDALRCAI